MDAGDGSEFHADSQYVAALDSPHNDVLENPRDVDTCRSWHRRIIRRKES